MCKGHGKGWSLTLRQDKKHFPCPNGSVVGTGMQSCAPSVPSTNTAPSLSPQWFSHCLVTVSKVTLEQTRELIRMRAGLVLRARLLASLLLPRKDSGAKGEAASAAHLQPAGLWCRLCRAWGQQQSLPCSVLAPLLQLSSPKESQPSSLPDAFTPLPGHASALALPMHTGWGTKVL